MAVDHGVELALAGEVADVAAVLGERLELGLGVLARHALVTAQVGVGLLDALAGDAGGLEDAARIGLVVGEGAEQVLTRHIGVAELGRELLGRVGHAHEVVADARLRGIAAHARLTRDGRVDLRLDGARVRAHALDDGGEVVLPAGKKGLEQVQRRELGRVGVRRDADGGLQGLLGGYCPFV